MSSEFLCFIIKTLGRFFFPLSPERIPHFDAFSQDRFLVSAKMKSKVERERGAKSLESGAAYVPRRRKTLLICFAAREHGEISEKARESGGKEKRRKKRYRSSLSQVFAGTFEGQN